VTDFTVFLKRNRLVIAANKHLSVMTSLKFPEASVFFREHAYPRRYRRVYDKNKPVIRNYNLASHETGA
jgi:hypothetical protein